MTQDVYEFSNDGRWGIACKFYKDGEEHVTCMDFVSPISPLGTLEDVEKHINEIFLSQINQPYQDHLLYSPYPKERVEGFVYDGFRVKRSHKLEQEFVEIEKNLHSYPDNIGYIREIHKYYYYETWRGIKTYREVIESKAIEDHKVRVQEYSNGEKVHWLDLRRVEVEKLSNSSNSFYLPGFFDEKQKQDKINELERAGSDWIPEFELLSKSQLSPRYLCKLVRAVEKTSQNYIHQVSA